MHPLTRTFLGSLAGLLDVLRAAIPAVAQTSAAALDPYLAHIKTLESLVNRLNMAFLSDELREPAPQIMARVSNAAETLRRNMTASVGRPDSAERMLTDLVKVLDQLAVLAALGDGVERRSAGEVGDLRPSAPIPPASFRSGKPVPKQPTGPARSAEGTKARSSRPPGGSQGQPSPSLPRYANAVLLEEQGKRRLNSGAPLAPGQMIQLRLDIGALSEQSHVTNAVPLPEERLPKDIALEVMVSSNDFRVAVAGEQSNDERIAHGSFFLPPDGGSASTPEGGKYLYFRLRAPDTASRAYCRIGYYFRNILVQSQQLSADVGETGEFFIKTDYTITHDLTGLEHLPTRPRLSVLTNLNDTGVHQIVVRAQSPVAGQPILASTFSVNQDTLGPTITRLRAALTERAPISKARRKAELARDLELLTGLGWTLYSQLPAQRPDLFDPLFADPDGFVLQVSRPTSSGFVVPWALMYEIPLSSTRTTLCPLVAQWDDSKPLTGAGVHACPYGPHIENVLCPFGFLGFRYAIEQLSSSDSPVLEIRAHPECDIVVGLTQFDVDLKALAQHIATLRSTVTASLPSATVREGTDLNTLKTLLGKDIPLVYFYCHGESLNAADPNTWLAVGKREVLSAKDFIAWIVAWRRQKRKVWSDVRPLIFVNACHSLAIYPDTLISYLDAFVGTARAAGVIGTEVKVQQGLASNFAERFFELFLTGKYGVEAALRAVRHEYLAAGNLFGLVYTSYCWADLRIVR